MCQYSVEALLLVGFRPGLSLVLRAPSADEKHILVPDNSENIQTSVKHDSCRFPCLAAVGRADYHVDALSASVHIREVAAHENYRLLVDNIRTVGISAPPRVELRILPCLPAVCRESSAVVLVSERHQIGIIHVNGYPGKASAVEPTVRPLKVFAAVSRAQYVVAAEREADISVGRVPREIALTLIVWYE